MTTDSQTPRLLVVVVNFRTPELTIECLRSAQSCIKTLGNARVTVVENSSGDDSFEKISSAIESEGWQSWASIVASPANGGFSAGNNVAIRPALASDSPPDLVLLLNPDTRVVGDALVQMVEFMTNTPEAGIAGARLEWEDGTPRVSAFRFPSVASELNDGLSLGIVARLLSRWELSRGTPDTTCVTDWVPGAAMMIRRDVFDAIGLMDENYFLYYEEVDFCLQAKRAGWPCWYLADAVVIHIEGQATGVEYGLAQPRRRPTYWFDSRRRFFVKNFGRPVAVLADLAQAGGLALWHLKRLVLRQPDDKPEALLVDLVKSSALWNR